MRRARTKLVVLPKDHGALRFQHPSCDTFSWSLCMQGRLYSRIPLSITAVVLLLAAGASAGAQSTEAGRKSPTLARVIGVLPGAGHMYAGEPGKGFAYLGGIAGVLVLSTMLFVTDCLADAVAGGANSADPCPATLLENATAAATLGIWGWSIYDAGRAANRTNAPRGLVASVRLVPTMQRRSLSRTTSAGALVAIRLGLR
jgi:hypothetical protein